MDPLSASLSRVDISTLPTWSVIPEHELDMEEHSSIDFEPLFAVRTDLNDKLILWCGDILSLEVDAIVNSSNETLSDRSDLCGRIFKQAGPLLVRDATALEGCRTGESKITHSHDLSGCSHIIHTVGPRYNIKYRTAAENALHGCYRSIIQVMVENKLRRVAVCVVNKPKRCYPKIEAAHIAFRTIRRCLESPEMGNNIFNIVFAVDNLDDYQIYMSVMKLYFPRNNRDVMESKEKYPEDIGNINEVGAKVITERKIRIAAFPSSSTTKKEPVVDERRAPSTRAPVDTESGLKAFMTPISGTPDERLRREQAKKTPKQLENEATDVLFEKLLTSAKRDDLSEIAKRNCIYQSGVDSLGRPIIVLVGARFPEKKDKLSVQQFTRYLIRTIDPIVNAEFVLVYFHAGITQPQEPEFNWLKLMYRFCERKYLPNLARLYVVHPSLWIKVTLKLLSPWMITDFKNRLKMTKTLAELFQNFDHSKMKVPDFVYRYDRKENGSSYLTEDNPANEGL